MNDRESDRRFVRTICRCDEDGKPAGQHSSDCPYQADLYAEAVRLALKPAPPSPRAADQDEQT